MLRYTSSIPKPLFSVSLSCLEYARPWQFSVIGKVEASPLVAPGKVGMLNPTLSFSRKELGFGFFFSLSGLRLNYISVYMQF